MLPTGATMAMIVNVQFRQRAANERFMALLTFVLLVVAQAAARIDDDTVGDGASGAPARRRRRTRAVNGRAP